MSLLSELILENYPLGFWNFNETIGTVALDSSGAGNDATYLGSVQLGQNPLVGVPDAGEKSIVLAGAGAVSVNAVSSFNSGEPFSIFTVFKRHSRANNQTLFRKGNSAYGPGAIGVAVRIEAGSDNLMLSYYADNWRAPLCCVLPSDLSETCTFGISYNGTTSLKVLLNGTVSAVVIPTLLNDGSGWAPIIGASREYGGYSESMVGCIDMFAWFPRAVSASLLNDFHIAATTAMTVSGHVEDSAGNGLARTLRVYDRATGKLLKTTTSRAIDGSYSVLIPVETEVNIIMLDDAAGTLENDRILRTIPA